MNKFLLLAAFLLSMLTSKAQNPYLPLWEYVPDAEPYVFEDPDHPGKFRLYIYGSHDSLRDAYCGLEQVVWSAPIDNLTQWRYDGIIFTSVKDRDGNLLHSDGRGDLLYAPDVTMREENGQKVYYLYPNNQEVGREGMVAKSLRPDGPFEVINWSTTDAQKTDGVLRFDPAVFIDDDGRVYGYWGFQQSFGAELDPVTMATVKEGTEIVTDLIPNLGQDDTFRFFEASSIRKIKDKYVFIYSRQTRNGEFGLGSSHYTLAYAYSDSPLGPFTYGGTIIDGRARGVDHDGNPTYTAHPDGNTHGSIIEIDGQWWVFYHRQTGTSEYSRQATVEPITVEVEEGPGGKVTISEAEYTSMGFLTNGLNPYQRQMAGIACYYTGPNGSWESFPTFFHSGSYVQPTYYEGNPAEAPSDFDLHSCPVVNNTSGSVVGYKYFNFDILPESDHIDAVFTLQPGGLDGSITILAGSPWTDRGGTVLGTLELTSDMPQTIIPCHVTLSGLSQLKGKQAVYLVFQSDQNGSLCTLHHFQLSTTWQEQLAIAQSLDLTGLAQEKITALQEAMDTDYASLDAERKKEAMHRLVSAIALIQIAQKNLTEPQSPYHGSKVHAGNSYYLYNVGHAQFMGWGGYGYWGTQAGWNDEGIEVRLVAADGEGRYWINVPSLGENCHWGWLDTKGGSNEKLPTGVDAQYYLNSSTSKETVQLTAVANENIPNAYRISLPENNNKMLGYDAQYPTVMCVSASITGADALWQLVSEDERNPGIVVEDTCRYKALQFTTTEAQAWQMKRVAMSDKVVGTPSATFHTTDVRSTFRAWGTCFNELDWIALKKLTEEERAEFFHRMFSPTGDLRFALGRIPLGASDYAGPENFYDEDVYHQEDHPIDRLGAWYSCDEMPEGETDFEMEHFTIERDKRNIIPFIKKAQEQNPDMDFWCSPWSPPQWMKHSHHYSNRAGYENGLDITYPAYTSTQFIMEEEYLQAYPKYFGRFIDAYAEEGINITGICYQNEAYTCNYYPNTSWEATSTARFNADYLIIPYIRATHPGVKVWLGTMNTGDLPTFRTILDYPSKHPDYKGKTLAEMFDGVGFQWEGRNAIATIADEYQARFPNLEFIQTESECGSGTFDWAAGTHTFELIHHYLNHGCVTYTNWNSILGGNGRGPFMNWWQNALVHLDLSTLKPRYTPEFYAYKHYSHFIGNGAKVLRKSSKEPLVLVAETGNGTYVVVAGNESNSERLLSIGIDEDKYLTATLPARSYNTFVIGDKEYIDTLAESEGYDGPDAPTNNFTEAQINAARTAWQQAVKLAQNVADKTRYDEKARTQLLALVKEQTMLTAKLQNPIVFADLTRQLNDATEQVRLTAAMESPYTGSTPEESEQYYLYNVKMGLWLNTGHGAWGTQAGLDEDGMLVSIYRKEGKTYIKTPDIGHNTYWGWYEGSVPKNSGAAYYYEAEVAGENGSMYCDVPFTGVNHAEAVEIEEVKQSNLIAPYAIIVPGQNNGHWSYDPTQHDMMCVRTNYLKDTDVWQFVTREERNNPTAIGTVSPPRLSVTTPKTIYDLSGRRVDRTSHGIYIINGKKVLR